MAGGIGRTPVGAAIKAHAAQMRKPPITPPGPMNEARWDQLHPGETEAQNDYSFAHDPRLHPPHPLTGFKQPPVIQPPPGPAPTGMYPPSGGIDNLMPIRSTSGIGGQPPGPGVPPSPVTAQPIPGVAPPIPDGGPPPGPGISVSPSGPGPDGTLLAPPFVLPPRPDGTLQPGTTR